MGTPQFPDLGKHCSVGDCKLIDFLPFTCDCCNLVFCLEHRSYIKHQCPKANKNDLTVVICPLCAKGVHLVPDQDPNITWELHVNTDCDPSNYDKVTKRRKCPSQGCREILTFSNTIPCRDCTIEHCLKHRFGPDHNCPGPKKPVPGFQFPNFFKQNQTRASNSSAIWTNKFLKAASSVRASAEAGFARLSSEFGQASGKDRARATSGNGQVEECPLCKMKFSSITALVDHVQSSHEKNGVTKVTLDVCPKCSKGFRDPVALVEHVERDHRGTSRGR